MGIKSLALIVPVFNEDKYLESTLDQLREEVAKLEGCVYEIICVDDGSSDGSAGILKERPGITVLTHRRNRGYGAALRTALTYTRSEWIFIVDADGTYPLDQLVQLLQSADQGADMVVGARSGPGISSHLPKRFARWILKKLIHVLTGVLVPDLNSGMRVFRRSLYEEFGHLLPTGFSFTTTITVACLYSQYRVIYVPIRYEKRLTRSNIRPMRDFFGFVILAVRLASYFEPLTFFLPASGTILLIAVLRGIRDVWVTNAIGIFAALLALLAIQILAVGILADVVVRRFSVSNPTRSRPPNFEIAENPPAEEP